MNHRAFEAHLIPASARGQEASPNGPERQGGVLCVALDTTAEQRFLNMRAGFIAAMAHEVRTPLSSIVGYAEMLLDGDAGEMEGDVREFVEIIAGNAVRLTNLIRDLVAVENLEGGMSTARWEHFDLTPMINRVATDNEKMLHQKSLRLELKLEPHLLVRGDRDRLSQVLHSLLSASIRLTSEGQVRIGAWSDKEAEGDVVIVRVQDSGTGMDTMALHAVMNNYHLAEPRVIRALGGTGLGLAIANEIVKAHHGRLKVETEEGAGSTFTLILPRAEAKTAPVQ